jgi:hypothetical protein
MCVRCPVGRSRVLEAGREGPCRRGGHRGETAGCTTAKLKMGPWAAWRWRNTEIGRRD